MMIFLNKAKDRHAKAARALSDAVSGIPSYSLFIFGLSELNLILTWGAFLVVILLIFSACSDCALFGCAFLSLLWIGVPCRDLILWMFLLILCWIGVCCFSFLVYSLFLFLL